MVHLIQLCLLFSIGGLIAGLTAGLFGLGGGAVLVPLLLILLPKIGATPNMAMHQAVGTSLAIIVFSTLMASYKQYQDKNLDLNLLRRWIPWVLIGVIAASFMFKHVPAKTLQLLFMGYMLLCALYMMFKKPAAPVALSEQRPISRKSLSLAGGFVGMLSIFLGVGGGTFTVPYFMANQYTLKRAIALSAATGLFVGVVGSVFSMVSGYGATGGAHYSIGYVNFLALLLVTPFSMYAAIYGVKLNHRLATKTLTWSYVGFLLAIVADMAYSHFL